MGAMQTALELRSLAKGFPHGFLGRRREVLRGLDLALGRGERLGLVGPNGSGKSTLLRLIAGVERPSAGEVVVLGGSPRTTRVRRRIGYLPEGNPFPRALRAREALDLLGALQGLERRERRERVERMLERVGLFASSSLALARFSQGMQRRLGLAQAFLHDPELILLDEPTAGLDAPGHVVLDELLSEARARGATLVIASHQPSDLLRFADSIALLFDGRVALRGAPGDLARGAARVRLDLEGLDAAALDALAGDVRARGGRVVLCGPTEATFVELYRRLGEPDGGRAR